MPSIKKYTPKKIYIKNDLPILHVDAVNTRHREDGVNYLSFATNLPDCIVEQVRLIIDDESLQRIVDDICQTTNYFPKKPSKKERSPSK